MSAIPVACPNCRATLKAPDHMIGHRAKCKKCGTKFVIPGGNGQEDSHADSQPLSVVDAPIENIPAAPAKKGQYPGQGARGRGQDENITAAPAKNEAFPHTASGDPFAFDASEPEPVGESRPSRPTPKPRAARKRRSVLLLAVVGLAVIGLAGGGAFLLLKSQNGPEQAKADKTEPKKEEPALPAPVAEEKTEPKEATPAPKATGKTRPTGKAARPMTPTTTGLKLPPGHTITLEPLADKPEVLQPPSNRIELAPTLPASVAAFPITLRLFPPLERDVDPALLLRTDVGFQGSGEKLALLLFSPQSGKQVNRLDVPGDGTPAPLCDLSASGDLFAHASAGMVTVWNTRDGSKMMDPFDPYASKPDHKAVGLAAVYLTEPPDLLVTVSTAGAVHAWKVPSKEPAGEFLPPKPAPHKLMVGKSVAPGPGKQSLVLLLGGTIYSISVRPTVAGTVAADLGSDPGKPLGLTVSGDGKVVLLFETPGTKPEKVILAVHKGDNHPFYRWPEAAGDPVSVGWCGENVLSVGTNRGAAFLFEAEGKGFRPLALLRTPGDRALHVPSDNLWSLLPDPEDPKKCLMTEFSMPPQGLVDPLNIAAKRPVFTLRLDDKGLHK